TRFVNGFVVFPLRVRISDDASTGLEIRFSIFQHGTSQRDAGIKIAVKPEIADCACVTAAPGVLQFADDLHGTDFWRAGNGPGGKRRSDNVRGGGTGARTAGYIRNDVHDVAVTLDFHHLGDANRTELRISADIISCEIDKHDVFRAFLWIGK